MIEDTLKPRNAKLNQLDQLTETAGELSEVNLHKVYVYARTLAQIEKERQPEKPVT